MVKYSLWAIALLALALIGFIGLRGQKSNPIKPTPTPTASSVTKLDIQFVNHIQAKLPEQDVFVVSREDPTKVVRVEGASAADPATLSQTVYATAVATPHDPFKVGTNPLGPFQKGASLGFSLKDWLAATGSGTYTVNGDTATRMSLSFQKLVPNSTYTVWCSRLTFPPNPKVVDRPCGKEDGSENVFKTDAAGNGSFNLTLKPLEASTKETASVIALAYHSDGKTYGAAPGDFGLHTHVQIFYLVSVPK